VQLQVAGLDEVAAPEGLVSIVDKDVLKLDTVHLAKHLRSVYPGIAHLQMVAIPQGRTGTGIKLATPDLEAMHMPERILSPEVAILSLYVRAFLDGTLTVTYRHLLQTHVMFLKQWSLALEMLLFYEFHN
jgi:hypothetical protein